MNCKGALDASQEHSPHSKARQKSGCDGNRNKELYIRGFFVVVVFFFSFRLV